MSSFQPRLIQRLCLTGVSCVVWLGSQSCGLTTRSIASLERIPTVPTTVRVAGTVGDRVPLIDQHLYELNDGSGVIWVLSSAPPLPAGTSIRLRASVRSQVISAQPQARVDSAPPQRSETQRSETTALYLEAIDHRIVEP